MAAGAETPSTLTQPFVTFDTLRGSVNPLLAENLTSIDPRDGVATLLPGGPSGSNDTSRVGDSGWRVSIDGTIIPSDAEWGSPSKVQRQDPGPRSFDQPIGQENVLALNSGAGVGEDWFERIHLFPSNNIDLGNVVSDQAIALDLYNAYRRLAVSLTSVVNNVSAQGVTISGLPTLPKNQAPQTSIPLTLSIDKIGPPNIDGTVVFDYDVRDLTLVLLGKRVVLLPYVPQREIRERLSWKTDVIESADGTEMRIGLRRFPRQEITYNYVMRNQRDLSTIRSLLTEWQPRVFGVPLWWWARKITADAAAGSLQVTVSSLANMDLRVGGLAMVAQTDPNDSQNILADVLEVDHFGSPENTVTFTSETTQAFSPVNGAVVVPVLACLAQQRIVLARQGTDFGEYRMTFLSTDNQVDLSDTTPFTTYQGKVLLDDPNFLPGKSYTEQLNHKNTRIDYDVGRIDAFSSKLLGVSTLPKRWQNNSNLEEWQRRGLLYALRGKQVSFFLPSFQKDFQLVADVGVSSANIDVQNVGYTSYVGARSPLRDIEIVLNDGTITRHRITGSSEVSTAVERLTISPIASQDFTVAEVKRISYLHQNRFDTDSPTIVHKWVDPDGDKKDSEIIVTTIGVPNDA